MNREKAHPTAGKRLKDFPGFDLNVAIAKEQIEPRYLHSYAFDQLGDVVIPGLRRLLRPDALSQLAMFIWSQKGHQEWEDRKRIRLVPQPPPTAANDCEAP